MAETPGYWDQDSPGNRAMFRAIRRMMRLAAEAKTLGPGAEVRSFDPTKLKGWDEIQGKGGSLWRELKGKALVRKGVMTARPKEVPPVKGGPSMNSSEFLYELYSQLARLYSLEQGQQRNRQ